MGKICSLDLNCSRYRQEPLKQRSKIFHYLSPKMGILTKTLSAPYDGCGSNG